MEEARKLFHLLGIVYVLVYWFSSNAGYNPMILPFSIFSLLLLFEYTRLSTSFQPPIVSGLWKKLRRKKENETFGAEILFSTSVLLSFAIFGWPIAAAATLMLTFGDPIAGLLHNYGFKFGKHGVGGVLACFAVASIVGIILLPTATALLMALSAALTETFSMKIDDNFSVPLVASFVGFWL